MPDSRVLAGLILLIQGSNTTPEFARQEADRVLALLDPVYMSAPKKLKQPKITEQQMRERIMDALAHCPHMPAMRELIALVRGNKTRVWQTAKSLIDEGIIEIVKEGRSVGIRVK